MTPTAPGVRRQDQILTTAITLLARHGVEGTTFARIRAEAGLSSPRLISYHFETKQALLQAVLAHVVDQAAAVMVPRMEAEPTARGKLRAYIESNLTFLAERPEWARAAVEIVTSARHWDDEERPSDERGVMLLAQLFAMGQEAGEMRAFDPVVMAVSLRAAVDAAALRLAGGMMLDARVYGDELAALFDAAVKP